MSALENFGDGIWIAAGPHVESMGFCYPTRMVVIRLGDGALFVCSPVALTDELRAAVDALGEVRSIVAPNALHHVSLPEWRAAYPKARLYAAPGLAARRKDIAFDEELGDDPPAAWAGEIDQAVMRGNAVTTEIVFFHRQSGAVMFTDLLQNFPRAWFKGVQALIAGMDGMIGDEARVPQKFRVAFINRRAARESLARVMAWPAARVLMAHGTPVRADAQAYLRRAFAWLA